MEKLCVFCKHWRFDGGEVGYSELTPGWAASMNCAKSRYGRFRLEDLGSESEFRSQILIAQRCPDFEAASV